MLPIILTITVICVVIGANYLRFQQKQRIVEWRHWINNTDVEIVEVPIGGTSEVHIWTYATTPNARIEVWNPEGNLVISETPQDKRNLWEQAHDFTTASHLIYRVDITLRKPIEGLWIVKIFKPVETSSILAELNVEAVSSIQVKAEISQPIIVNNEEHYQVKAGLYEGNRLICSQNIQIEIAIKVGHNAPPRSYTLQPAENCSFRGEVTLMRFADSGFYIVSKQGFIQRQFFFDKYN
jgi:hypothetical protein